MAWFPVRQSTRLIGNAGQHTTRQQASLWPVGPGAGTAFREDGGRPSASGSHLLKVVAFRRLRPPDPDPLVSGRLFPAKPISLCRTSLIPPGAFGAIGSSIHLRSPGRADRCRRNCLFDRGERRVGSSTRRCERGRYSVEEVTLNASAAPGSRTWAIEAVSTFRSCPPILNRARRPPPAVEADIGSRRGAMALPRAGGFLNCRAADGFRPLSRTRNSAMCGGRAGAGRGLVISERSLCRRCSSAFSPQRAPCSISQMHVQKWATLASFQCGDSCDRRRRQYDRPGLPSNRGDRTVFIRAVFRRQY